MTVSDWVNTLITGLVGLLGVAVGAGSQYGMERARERRQRLYEPAASMAAKLRRSATGLDYVIDRLLTRQTLEDDALPNAKQYIWEADGARTGIEFNFRSSTGVFSLATAAIDQLKDAYAEVDAAAKTDPFDASAVQQQLTVVKTEYESAIAAF